MGVWAGRRRFKAAGRPVPWLPSSLQSVTPEGCFALRGLVTGCGPLVFGHIGERHEGPVGV